MATEVEVNPSALEFVSSERRMLIGGDWVEAASGKTFEVYNPATGEVLANVAEGDTEDIDRAVKAARAAFETGPWTQMTPSERGRIIHRLADLILEHGDELAALETLDNGKPIAVARAADMPLAADNFRYYAGWATRSTARRSIRRCRTCRAPSSTPTRCASRSASSGQIIPWNFPLLMAAWKLGPALASRLHGRAEAGRADAAVGAAARRAGPGGRLPGRRASTSSPASARPPAPRWRRTPTSTRWRSPARPRSAS